MSSLGSADLMMEKFNLRSSFRNLAGIRECRRWIREMIDGENVDGIRIILRSPDIDAMGDEW